MSLAEQLRAYRSIAGISRFRSAFYALRDEWRWLGWRLWHRGPHASVAVQLEAVADDLPLLYERPSTLANILEKRR